MRELYKKILETEYKGKAIFRYVNEGIYTVYRAYEGSMYKNSDSKLMVIGRAMNGWGNDFSKLSLEEMLDTVCQEVFDFGDVINPKLCDKYGEKCNYNYIRSKFWKLIKFVLEEYGEANEHWYDSSINNGWNEKIVWSNLYKISPKVSGNPPWKIMGLNIEEYIDILKKEIEAYQPERILFVTDNNYLVPDEKKSSFLSAFDIKEYNGGEVVGTGIYGCKKIVVCKRPDRRGMSNDKIREMAKEIKKAFENN